MRQTSLPGRALMLALAVAASAEVSAQPAESPGWLVILQGEVTAVADGRLAIAAGASALAFTDRPARLVRFIDLKAFIAEAWGPDGELRLEPPNAALVDETHGTIGVIEITEAIWDAGITIFAFVNLEGLAPAPGDRIALTIDVVHPTQY